MQEEDIVMTKHVSSKGKVFFDNSNMVKQRLYFLIIQYLSQEESFDKRLLSQIKDYAETNNLLGQMLAMEGGLVDATFDELNFQQKGCKSHPTMFSKDENLNNILSVYQTFSAQRVKCQNARTQNAFIQKMIKLATMLSEPAMFMQPTRELFIKRKKLNNSQISGEAFSNDTFILRFQHLKTCFGHAYSADSGSVNEESGEPYIPIYNTTFDKSGRLVITADEEGLIKIWSAENGLLLSNLKGHTSGILSNDISPCNKYLVTCSIDKTARVWDIFNQRCLTCFRSIEQLNAVVFYKHQNEFTEQLYLLMMSNVGNILIYKEDQFKENGGGINTNLQPVMTLAMRKHKKMQDSRIVDKDTSNEAVCIETHPSGYLVVGTETGEILVWEKIHTLENRNRQVLPFIEKKEHSKNCQLIKFSPNGEFMITASFDGYAKIWPWKKLIENDKKLSEFIYSIYFDNTNKCEKNCWNVAFSCKNKYAFATFTRKMKRTKEVETVVYVHDLVEKKIKHEFTQQNTPAKLQDHILVFEPHPTQENILLTADYAGQIILYDVSIGCILNIFQERGYHIGYPNLEVPVLDGCWAPDGFKFIASTYYGSFSLYGYDCVELYKTTPTEQFFANDTEIFIYSDNHVPLAVDDDVEINTKTRGKICDYQRIPYRFEYNNNLKKLMERGFFEETSDVALKCIEDKLSELKLQEQQIKEQDENNQDNLVEKYHKNQEKEKDAYLTLCNQLRDSYNNANLTMEGSMRVDYNERMEILKKMSKEMHQRHKLNVSQETEAPSNEQIFSQIAQSNMLRPSQQERVNLDPLPLLNQESEQPSLNNQRNNNRRRVIDDEENELNRAHSINHASALNRRQSQMPVPAALSQQNSRVRQPPVQQRAQQGRRDRTANSRNSNNAGAYNDDFEDQLISEEEIVSQDDSEVNPRDMNDDDEEIQKDLQEELDMFDEPQLGLRNQANNRNSRNNRMRRGADDYDDDLDEEEKKGSSQRRVLKRFSNTTTQNNTRANTSTLNQAEGQQRQGTLRYNRNTRSSYSMQYSTGDDGNTQNFGYGSSQENEVGTTSRLRRRNLHDDDNFDANANSIPYSLRQSSRDTAHHPSHNTHQTRSSAASGTQEYSQNQKSVRHSQRSKKSKRKSMYDDDDFNSDGSESEDRFSDEGIEDEEEEVEGNYDDDDDFQYKLKKPKPAPQVQRNSTSRSSAGRLRTANSSRKKVQDSDEEEEEIISKPKNRSNKNNQIVEEDEEEEESQAELNHKHQGDNSKSDEDDFDNFDEEDEEYTDKKKRSNLKKRSSMEAGIKKNGTNGNRIIKKIKTNESENREDAQSAPDEKRPICERCEQLIEGEMRKCHICKKKFHEEGCHKYRGCLRDKRYFCFDCYAHNSTARTQKDEQDKKTFTRDYLERETHDPYQYIPQINDMCYYIFQAHEEFCEKYFEIFDYSPLLDRRQKEHEKTNSNGANKSAKKASTHAKSSKIIDSDDDFRTDEPSSYYQKKGQMFQNLEYHILPFLDYKTLFKPTLCQISQIEYFYPMLSTKKLQERHKERPIFLLIQLKILETGEEFSVYYSNSQVQCGNFLIPQEFYDHSVHYQSTIKLPQQIEFFYRGQVLNGQIIDISTKEEFCKSSEYMKLKVKVDGADEKLVSKLKLNLETTSNLTRISCWDVIHQVRRDSSPEDYPSDDTCLTKDETEQICKLIDVVTDNQNDITCYFEEAVNIKKYKHYYEFVEFPMDISKIKRRLQNGYYRSPQSIFHDIALIDQNAIKFNTPDSPICESSKKVKEILSSIINNFQNVEQCLSLVVKNKKNIPKTIQALFPNYVPNNHGNNNGNVIQIKLPQNHLQTHQPQPNLIPVAIEKPSVQQHNNSQMQVEQQQKLKYQNSNERQILQSQPQQIHPQQEVPLQQAYQMNQMNNNYLPQQQELPQQQQQYNNNNINYQQNIPQLQTVEQPFVNDAIINNHAPLQNVIPNGQFMQTGLTGLESEENNGFYEQPLINNHNNNSNNGENPIYVQQGYEPVNNSEMNFNNIPFNEFQGMNQSFVQSDYNSQNLGQQNMLISSNSQIGTSQQQRTTRSGRLTRNSSKFDYDQLDPRKN